jgi:pimeloyl-ACP methyl ester carboxylesterase
MPNAINGGVSIHYEVDGEGEPLVLQHMFPRDLESWRTAGYVAALKDRFQLILMDARGHGKSDRDPSVDGYRAEARAGDVVAVLDDLGVDKANYWGYSLGGRAGWCVAAKAQERLRSLIIGGAEPNPPERYLERPLERMSQAPDQYTKGLAACLEGLMSDPSWESILPGISVPCLLYAGDADGVFERMKQAATTIPGAQFVTLPELNHGQGFERSDLVLPFVSSFLQDRVLAH